MEQQLLTQTAEPPESPAIDYQAKYQEAELKAARAEAALEEQRKFAADRASQQPQQAAPQPQTEQLPQDWDNMSETDQLRWETAQRDKAYQAQLQQRDEQSARDRSALHASNFKREVAEGLEGESRAIALAEVESILKANPSALAQGYDQNWIETVQAIAEGKAVRKAKATAQAAVKEPPAASPAAGSGFEDYCLRRWKELHPGQNPSERLMRNMTSDGALKREWRDSQ